MLKANCQPVRVSQFFKKKTPPKGEGNVSVASPGGSATVLFIKYDGMMSLGTIGSKLVEFMYF